MNMSFKLGKVVIPVAEEVKIELEGLELSVSDYNLMEGLKVVQAMPKVLREIKAIIEGEDAPSADTKDEEPDDEVPSFIQDMIKKAGGHIIDTPFGKHVAIPKNPLGGKLPWEKPELKPMTGDDVLSKLFGGGQAPKNPLEDFLNHMNKDK